MEERRTTNLKSSNNQGDVSHATFQEGTFALDAPSIYPSTIINNVDEVALVNYLKVLNHEHAKEPYLTWKSVAINSPVIITTLFVAVVASSVYLPLAKESADGDELLALVYMTFVMLYTTLINFYFENELIAPTWNKIWQNTPRAVKDARCYNENKGRQFSAKFLRGAKSVFSTGSILLLAGAASGPTFALELRNEQHSNSNSSAVFGITTAKNVMLRPSLVFLATVPLMYASVEAIIFHLLPALIAPFKSLYRRLNAKALINHKIATDTEVLKNAHFIAIDAAHQKFLEYLQVGNTDPVAPILTLLKKDKPTEYDTFHLIQSILRLAPISVYEYRKNLMFTVQIISLAMTACAVYGLYPITKNGTDQVFGQTFNIENQILSNFIAALFFLAMVAIAFEISWNTFGEVYKIVEYAFHGIKETILKTSGFLDCFGKAYQHKFDPQSWYKIIRLPLPAIQNPGIIINLQINLVLLSYFSTQPNTYINPKSLFLITVLIFMVFDSYPVDKIIGKAQMLFKLIKGSVEEIDQIRMVAFLNNYKNIISGIDSQRFLEIVNGFINANLTDEQTEVQLQLFFGKKNSTELFGIGHSYAGQKYSHIITRLRNCQPAEHSSTRFFNQQKKQLNSAHNNREQETLLTNQGYGYGYGT